jgi:hypothetical protein
MKSTISWILLLLTFGAVHHVSAALNIRALRTSSSNSVTQVVELLKQLVKKVESEMHTDEDLFMKYKCWATSVLNSKAATNEEAKTRIQYLEKYIADIDNGVFNFTTEEGDLTAQLASHLADMDSAKDMRAKQNNQFLLASADMQGAIKSLDLAVPLVCDLSTGSSEAFAQVGHSHNAEARLEFATFTAQSERLSEAAKLGDKYLSKGDALFLRRLLTSDVPSPDYESLKKMSDNGQLKVKYEARSKGICSTLTELQTTFQTNLQDATTAENEQVTKYTALSAAQSAEKDRLQLALADLEKENGARGLNKDDAAAEIGDLNAQLATDTQVIADINAALATKREEYDQRQELRKDEIKALEEAISILHNDEARDLFAKTAVNKLFFLQTSTSSSSRAKATQKLVELREQSRDGRVSALVTLAGKMSDDGYQNSIDLVVSSIDSLISQLHTEGDEDLSVKEECENKRLALTRTMVTAARQVDQNTATIWTREQEVEHIDAQIASLNTAIANSESQLAKMTDIRQEEHAEFVKVHADISQSEEVVKQARTVIEQFYQARGLMLVQQAPMLAGGKLPPPPPPTWEDAYLGKREESTGIIAILTMIEEDFQKDAVNVQETETKAQEAFSAEKVRLETAIGEYTDTVNLKETDRATAEQSKSELQSGNEALRADIAVQKQTLQAATHRCLYYTVHFQVRREARAMEIEGLENAKTILLGGHVQMGFLQRSA